MTDVKKVIALNRLRAQMLDEEISPAVYFAAIGGAAALMAKQIRSAEVIAFDDLGAEAVRKLYVEDMPLTVVLDSHGGNLYREGQAEYLNSVLK